MTPLPLKQTNVDAPVLLAEMQPHLEDGHSQRQRCYYLPKKHKKNCNPNLVLAVATIQHSKTFRQSLAWKPLYAQGVCDDFSAAQTDV